MKIMVLTYLRRHHIGLLALAVAMGGTAYAAETINSRDIADGTIKSRDLQNGAVLGRDIRSDALKGSQIDESTLDDASPSATVAGQGAPTLIQKEGIEAVERTGTGVYHLILGTDQKTCSFTGSFYGLESTQTGDGGTVAVAYSPGAPDLTVVLRDHAGDLVNLGEGNGPFGFTVVSGC